MGFAFVLRHWTRRVQRFEAQERPSVLLFRLSPDWRYNNFCGRRSGVRHEGKSLACVSLVERSDVDEIIKFLLAVVLLSETASKIELHYSIVGGGKRRSSDEIILRRFYRAIFSPHRAITGSATRKTQSAFKNSSTGSKIMPWNTRVPPVA